MTAVETAPPAENPARRLNWLKIALVTSLAVNLLFVGGGLARLVTHGPLERMSNISQMQLIPRKFLGDLDRARRAELMQVFREFAPVFRNGRKATRDEVINLAAALEAEPYDAAKVKAVVEIFSAQSSALIGNGGKAALTLIDKLSPEERKLLARHIRLRDDNGHRKNTPGRDD